MGRKKRQEIKRPFATRCYRSITDGEGSYVRQGACTTEEGAKKSGYIKCGLQYFAMVRVYDRYTEAILWTFRRTSKGVTEHFGRAGELRNNVIPLRRKA